MKSEFVKLTRFGETRHVYIRVANIFKLDEAIDNGVQGSFVTYSHGKSADCTKVQETPEEIISLISDKNILL